MPYQTGWPDHVIRSIAANGLVGVVRVEFVAGWETRGSSSFNPRGVILHHDASSMKAEYESIRRNHVSGRVGLPGPICHADLSRRQKDGRFILSVIAAGTCLEENTSVLTANGFKAIRDVVVGDLVWTHRRRWRCVTDVRSFVKPTVTVRATGQAGTRCTVEHRWVARDGWSDRAGVRRWRPAPARVVETADLDGMMLASPVEGFDETAVPVPDVDGVQVTVELMRVVGAWVADGFIHDVNQATTKAAYVVPRAGDKSETVGGWCEAAGITWRREADNQGTGRFKIGGDGLARWLIKHFGRRSTGRTVPAWLLSGPDKLVDAFLDGYLHGDGYQVDPPGNRAAHRSCSTSSRNLAYGLSMLANRVGWYALVGDRRWPAPSIVKGRECRPTAESWSVSFYPDRPRTARRWLVAGELLSKARVEAGLPSERVYDLTVDEDESFIADGMITHNSNHGGVGQWRGVSGNSNWFGLETSNTGVAGEQYEPWPDEQLALVNAVAAGWLDYLGRGVEWQCEHKEYGTPLGRKVDRFQLNGSTQRDRTAAALARLRAGGGPVVIPTSEEDDMKVLICRTPDGAVWACFADRRHHLDGEMLKYWEGMYGSKVAERVPGNGTAANPGDVSYAFLGQWPAADFDADERQEALLAEIAAAVGGSEPEDTIGGVPA